MIKKIYSSSFKMLSFMLVLGMQNACAEDVQSMRDMGNFTIGADLMYEGANVKYSSNNYDCVDSGVPYRDEINVDVHNGYNRFSPVINLGVSYICKNLYIGLDGEIIIGRSKTVNHKILSQSEIGYSKIKGFAYGLKGKLGGFIDSWNTTVYGIAGFRSRDMKMFMDDSCNSYEFGSVTIKKPSIVLGVGIEKPVYKNITISAEYEYAWRKHGRVWAAGNPGAFCGDFSMFNVNFDTKLSEHSFRIGLKYHF